MDYTALHASKLVDFYEAIKRGVADLRKSSSGIGRSTSLARATSGLTLVFPVLCTDTLPIDAATMVSKAVERKATTMLQMALSAYNITNATDAIEHLKNFHTNLDIDSLTVDKFIDIMDSVSEGVNFTISEMDKRAVYEDCRRNINYYFADDINPISLNEFRDRGANGSVKIIKEARNKDDYEDGYNQGLYDAHDERDAEKFEYQKSKDVYQQKYRERKDAEDAAYRREKDKADRIAKNASDKLNMQMQKVQDQNEYFKKMLIDTDVKKANEMQPTLILVNYYVNDSLKGLNIAQQAVAGVKAKLYPIASVDIINRLITRHADGDVVLKLVKLSTREISVIRDFLLGADEAKMDALGSSKKNSGSKVFNALERRAGKNKVFKYGRMDNAYKAITTLVITAEEAEEIKKNSNLDVSKPSSIIPIMTKLNLLHFVIVDTTSEAVAILTDGDSKYEMYSFANLEREASDTNYKKVINLMTKVAR